jgi:hypothetical protein
MKLYDFGTAMLILLVSVGVFTACKFAVDEWYSEQPWAYMMHDDGPVEEIAEEILEGATGADIDLSPWNADPDFRDD